jgi:hypothetical protein
MFIKLSLRAFWILLLVLSSLWLSALLLTVPCGIFWPAGDFQEIVHALQLSGEPPPRAAAAVQQTMAAAGILQRALSHFHNFSTCAFEPALSIRAHLNPLHPDKRAS